MTDYEADLMIAHAEIATLKRQLAESQRREKAAVEDISRVANKERVMPCAVCRYEERPTLIDGEVDKSLPCWGCCESNSKFEYRGPQESEKGEAT